MKLKLTHSRYARGEYEYDDTMADSELAVCEDDNNCTSPRGPLDLPMARKNWIDSEITNEKDMPKVQSEPLLKSRPLSLSVLI